MVWLPGGEKSVSTPYMISRFDRIHEQRRHAQSNGTLEINAAIGTLAVDGWDVTFGTASRGLGGQQPAEARPCSTKCDSPPINGQCTNFILFDEALYNILCH